MEDIIKKVNEDMDAMVEWYKEEYDDIFLPYFKDIQNLYSELQDKNKLIDDSKLEMILTELPINMFSVAESLNAFKLRSEVIKLKIKEVKREVKKESEAKTQAEKNIEAEEATLELEVLLRGYNAVIDRVDRESTFCKELIMSAKKVWTARRQSEDDLRVVEKSVSKVDSDNLPDYRFEE